MSEESLAAMEIAGDTGFAAPVARQQRISSLDVLRGVAVLGILLMNIVGFGLPHWAYDDPSVVGGATGLNLWTWICTSMLFEGTMRAMFSMLFGAGVILLTSRLESHRSESSSNPETLSPADIYFRRNIWLIVFGMFHSYVMLWLGDILYVYGVVGMFMYAFRRLLPRTLIGIAFVLLMIITARTMYERHQTLTLIANAAEAETARAAGLELSEVQTKALEKWDEKREELKPDRQTVRDEIEDGQKGYVHLLVTSAPINLWLQTKYLYKHSFLDAASMMFLGMALLKLGVLSNARSARTYLTMLVAGYAVGLSVNAWETITTIRGEFGIQSFANASLTYDLGRVAMVIGHIGLVMLVIRSGAMRWLIARLAAVGQMALTNYLMQTVLCSLLFYGFGWGLFGELSRCQLYLVVLGVWIIQIALSPVWLRSFNFGPAEWLWRSLTYWQRQPMRRANGHAH